LRAVSPGWRAVKRIVRYQGRMRGEALMKYRIALQRSEAGYSVSVPGLPGCRSQGDTEREALENIRDAIREYLAARDELVRGATVRVIEVADCQAAESDGRI